MQHLTEADITAAVLGQLEHTPSPRLQHVLRSLITHLHAFVRDVQLTEAEWFEGIRFLTEAGQMCTDKRQEFILLSDALGVSMLVDLINHQRPEGATETTLLGPFYAEGVPEMAWGESIAQQGDGAQTFFSGRVLDMAGNPIQEAVLDVWQTAANGLYDVQDAKQPAGNMRGKFRTNVDGTYMFRTVRPRSYSIPCDGPVGQLFAHTDRHTYRPAHIHFIVTAEGFAPLTTHLFDAADTYLDSDAVFAVKPSLICEFVRHETLDKAPVPDVSPPYYTAAYDFVLTPR